tara:strand:- start:494 stop:901 length:408 start_codon:yes stop_codon:yes gene_type:complete
MTHIANSPGCTKLGFKGSRIALENESHRIRSFYLVIGGVHTNQTTASFGTERGRSKTLAVEFQALRFLASATDYFCRGGFGIFIIVVNGCGGFFGVWAALLATFVTTIFFVRFTVSIGGGGNAVCGGGDRIVINR